MKPEKLEIEYDEKSDVLYISVGKPKEADDSVEPQEGVVMRSRKGRLVGITIVGLKNCLYWLCDPSITRARKDSSAATWASRARKSTSSRLRVLKFDLT